MRRRAWSFLTPASPLKPASQSHLSTGFHSHHPSPSTTTCLGAAAVWPHPLRGLCPTVSSLHWLGRGRPRPVTSFPGHAHSGWSRGALSVVPEPPPHSLKIVALPVVLSQTGLSGLGSWGWWGGRLGTAGHLMEWERPPAPRAGPGTRSPVASLPLDSWSDRLWPGSQGSL